MTDRDFLPKPERAWARWLSVLVLFAGLVFLAGSWHRYPVRVGLVGLGVAWIVSGVLDIVGRRAGGRNGVVRGAVWILIGLGLTLNALFVITDTD